MAWSDAARAAALEARRMHSRNLASVITSGVKNPLTIQGLRSRAAQTIRHNRKLGLGLPIGIHYALATAAVRITKNNMVRAMSKFHPMYSKGTNPAKFK